MKNVTFINDRDWFNNEPISSESYPTTSVLPERFRSLTLPIGFSLVPDDWNSITEPISFVSETNE